MGTIADKVNNYRIFGGLNLHITRKPIAEPIYMGRKLPGRALSRRFSENSPEHQKYYLPSPQQKIRGIEAYPRLPHVFRSIKIIFSIYLFFASVEQAGPMSLSRQKLQTDEQIAQF